MHDCSNCLKGLKAADFSSVCFRRHSYRAQRASLMIVHFPGLEGLDMPAIWVFPKLLDCMDCGFTEFAIPETELVSLAKRYAQN